MGVVCACMHLTRVGWGTCRQWKTLAFSSLPTVALLLVLGAPQGAPSLAVLLLLAGTRALFYHCYVHFTTALCVSFGVVCACMYFTRVDGGLRWQWWTLVLCSLPAVVELPVLGVPLCAPSLAVLLLLATGRNTGRVSPLPCMGGGHLEVCVGCVCVCACMRSCGTRYDACNSLLGARRNIVGMLLDLPFVTVTSNHVCGVGVVGNCGQPAWI